MPFLSSLPPSASPLAWRGQKSTATRTATVRLAKFAIAGPQDTIGACLLTLMFRAMGWRIDEDINSSGEEASKPASKQASKQDVEKNNSNRAAFTGAMVLVLVIVPA